MEVLITKDELGGFKTVGSRAKTNFCARAIGKWETLEFGGSSELNQVTKSAKVFLL